MTRARSLLIVLLLVPLAAAQDAQDAPPSADACAQPNLVIATQQNSLPLTIRHGRSTWIVDAESIQHPLPWPADANLTRVPTQANASLQPGTLHILAAANPCLVLERQNTTKPETYVIAHVPMDARLSPPGDCSDAPLSPGETLQVCVWVGQAAVVLPDPAELPLDDALPIERLREAYNLSQRSAPGTFLAKPVEFRDIAIALAPLAGAAPSPATFTLNEERARVGDVQKLLLDYAAYLDARDRVRDAPLDADPAPTFELHHRYALQFFDEATGRAAISSSAHPTLENARGGSEEIARASATRLLGAFLSPKADCTRGPLAPLDPIHPCVQFGSATHAVELENLSDLRFDSEIALATTSFRPTGVPLDVPLAVVPPRVDLGQGPASVRPDASVATIVELFARNKATDEATKALRAVRPGDAERVAASFRAALDALGELETATDAALVDSPAVRASLAARERQIESAAFDGYEPQVSRARIYASIALLLGLVVGLGVSAAILRRAAPRDRQIAALRAAPGPTRVVVLGAIFAALGFVAIVVALILTQPAHLLTLVTGSPP